MNKQEELLVQVLEECLEEDLSFVPPEREIARKHRFSESFEQAMQKLLKEISHRSGEKEIQRHFLPRYGQWAACILVFCVCGWLFYQVSGQIGSKDAAPAEIDESQAFDSAAGKTEDAGEGNEQAAEESGTLQEETSDLTTAEGGQVYCGRTVYPAEIQDVPESLEGVTTLVNCPVLDEENPVLMLTIGNVGEEDIRYLNRYDLEVWLKDAWYRIPAEKETEGEWLTLEANMAVDEEIDLSKYQMDYDASQYRLVTYVEQDVLGVEFTFEEVFKKTMEETERN